MPPTDPRVPRRRFLKTVGLVGLSSALVPKVLAQSPPAPGSGATTPPAPADTTAAKPAEISEDARALAAVIQRRYGKNLSPEQIESIARDFDGDLRATKRLRETVLANSDEPDVTFRA